jgi:hypothetical protein
MLDKGNLQQETRCLAEAIGVHPPRIMYLQDLTICEAHNAPAATAKHHTSSKASTTECGISNRSHSLSNQSQDYCKLIAICISFDFHSHRASFLNNSMITGVIDSFLKSSVLGSTFPLQALHLSRIRDLRLNTNCITRVQQFGRSTASPLNKHSCQHWPLDAYPN